MSSSEDDDADNVFEYDRTMDDAFNNLDIDNIASARQEPTNSQNAARGTNLGIDEEIKIAKKRQPIAKLDEARLLSAAGIPKLRRISKERLKFKGKGHEFSDIVRLLNMYQLWLDDLYPRAKFADGLAIIEKLGHSKRIQMMRREWIEEGKPKATADIDQDPDAHIERDEPSNGVPNNAEQTPLPERTAIETGRESATEHNRPTSLEEPKTRDDEGAWPDEDELDALLGEDFAGGASNDNDHISGAVTSMPSRPLISIAAEEEDAFAAEMEVMAEMDDMW
ncbi:Swi3-domain-containing protein [Lepidopterella palustris CBS 459.81]|uniref:Chromosome segregation in meiosis protein n=1 Tax=Lepidopterella palustris CBS 459.81 TaxID=1314670 RepID=A0A8E2EG30_9PEZI|nr:Swi3-domain-containing protein [Lepidopterella palustris CBS 459.81]